jgi:hypothetical protein
MLGVSLLAMVAADPILPGTGRGTMQSMVEGHAR